MAADYIIFANWRDAGFADFEVLSRGAKMVAFARILQKLGETDPILSQDFYLHYLYRSVSHGSPFIDLSRCSDSTISQITKYLLARSNSQHPYWETWLEPLNIPMIHPEMDDDNLRCILRGEGRECQGPEACGHEGCQVKR